MNCVICTHSLFSSTAISTFCLFAYNGICRFDFFSLQRLIKVQIQYHDLELLIITHQLGRNQCQIPYHHQKVKVWANGLIKKKVSQSVHSMSLVPKKKEDLNQCHLYIFLNFYLLKNIIYMKL